MSNRTAAKTITRTEAPSRVPDNRIHPPGFVPEDQRDPRKIYSRDGREITQRFTGDEDRFNLAALGVFAPDGWEYQWKTKTIKNWEWVDHQVELYQNGWTPVPADRHDGKVMPPGHVGPIEKGGLILMECDKRQVARLRMADKRRADDRLREANDTQGAVRRFAPNVNPASMDFENSAAQKFTRENTGSQREQVGSGPRQGGYQYEIDE